MMVRFWLFLLLASSVAAEETCCIDEDIAAAFLRHANYSRSWPASFPIEIDNASLEFIASSLRRDGQHTEVAWKSDLNPDDARQLVSDTLRGNDWKVIPQGEQVRTMYQRGFIPHQPTAAYNNQQFCREREGSLTILSRSTDIGTVLTLSHNANRGARDCDEVIAAQSSVRRYDSGLVRYLPALRLPEAINIPSYFGSGSGGGSDDAHASISLETTVSTDNLMTTFDRQMVDQGWRMDANFRGNTTIGRTWLRDVDGLELTCIVTAVSGASNKVRLRMHLEPT